MSRILDMRPISSGAYRQRCECYLGFKPKPLRLEIDEENDIVFCRHCGNLMSPMHALHLIAGEWDRIEADIERAREYVKYNYKLAHNYRPRHRALKRIEQGVGRKGEMLPVCPNCRKGFELEKVTMFVNRRYAELVRKGEDG